MAPPLSKLFSLAGGSALGRAHGRSGRNNQDAFALREDGDRIVAVVADGCSQGRSSEVGARLAATWIAANGPRLARTTGDATSLAEALAGGLRAMLGGALDQLAPRPGERAAVIGELFLFTLLVAVLTPERALVLGRGDGLYAIDGTVVFLDSGVDNAPDYLAYALLADDDARARDGALRVLASVPLDEIESLVIATDGAAAFEQPAAEAHDHPAATLAEVALDARYAANPSLLQKRLHALASSDRRLQDDVTIALLRRRPS